MRITLSFVLTLVSSAALAQPLGIYAWQLQPYCNVVTLDVHQGNGVFTLSGWDDQCGGTAPRAPLVGAAALNPDGTIGLGLNIVLTPGGVPLHVDAVISLPSGAGTWRDSAGNSGLFVPGPALPGSSPRTLSGIGAAAINPAQVQTRVSGVCSSGQLMTGVNQDGSVVCESVTGAAGGDVTSVTAGPGLTGGGQTGDITLGVSFGGSGSADSAARSDHSHTTSSNVIVVAKSGGDFDSIQAAVDSITDSSADNPYVIRIGPGVYDEKVRVVGKTDITFQGSGRDATIIRTDGGTTPGPDGTFDMAVFGVKDAHNITLRSFSVINSVHSDVGGMALFTAGVAHGLVAENMYFDSVDGGESGKDTVYLGSFRDGYVFRNVEIVGSFDVLSFDGTSLGVDSFDNVAMTVVGFSSNAVIWASDNPARAHFRNCRIQGNFAPGFIVWNDGTEIDLINCQLRGAPYTTLFHPSGSGTPLRLNVVNTDFESLGISAPNLTHGSARFDAIRKVKSLEGAGSAFVCVDSEGSLFRSLTPCAGSDE